MFRRFFKFLVTGVKKYVSKHGIIRSVCNAIEGAILSCGLFKLISNQITKWKIDRKIKKVMKEHGISEDDYREDHGVYDENGYRLTNEELYRKNMREMDEIEEIYTDDVRDCVKLIEMHAPQAFKGMTKDMRFKWVKKNGLTMEGLMKKFGLDKETQIKKAKAAGDLNPDAFTENSELQKKWNEKESSKVGIASKVSKDFKSSKKKNKNPKTLCKVIDYSAMEITYGCDNFNFADPNSESEIRRLRRMKFDKGVAVTNSYMSWVYLHNKDLWNKWMKKSDNDATKVWRFIMIAFLDNDEFFEKIQSFVEDKASELKSEMRGHTRSNRPEITSIEDDQILDKMEDLLERFDEMEMNKKRNTPNSSVDDDEDEDFFEEDDSDMSDEFDEALSTDFDPSTASRIDEINALYQESLKSEDEDSKEASSETSEEDKNEVATESIVIPENRQPVKMISKDSEDNRSIKDDPSVLNIPPKDYTIDLRAKKMIELYEELYAKDPNLADDVILDMLADEDGKNYKLYEASDVMKKNRQLDKSRDIPWKFIPTDYPNKEDRVNAIHAYQENIKKYGLKNMNDMLENATEAYRSKFESETVDSILKQVINGNLDHEIQVAIINCLYIVADEYTTANYVYNVESIVSPELCKEAAAFVKPEPVMPDNLVTAE